MVIGEGKVRATTQEYDGWYYVRIEHGACAHGWTVLATFKDDCCPEHALNRARSAGWAWLVDQ